jgi:predicted PolB exonuclease-like 3'-5' exonuclease
MPTLSAAQYDEIRDELLDAYKAKFGENWSRSLTKNLIPSPVKQIAERHGVSLKAVQEVKHSLWLTGMLMNMMAEQASPSTIS